MIEVSSKLSRNLFKIFFIAIKFLRSQKLLAGLRFKFLARLSSRPCLGSELGFPGPMSWPNVSSQRGAVVPQILLSTERKLLAEIVAFVFGVALISGLAQVAVSLPWTPVPITGQTLGVTLVALSWGRARALAVVLTYLAIGGLGLPVFAMGKFGLSFGPTFGYLLGMGLSAGVVGELSDRGFTKSFASTFLVAVIGSVVTMSCGLLVLSAYVPKDQLLLAGFFPFIPGDIIKNLIATKITTRLR